jgi:hypothetical protein
MMEGYQVPHQLVNILLVSKFGEIQEDGKTCIYCIMIFITGNFQVNKWFGEIINGKFEIRADSKFKMSKR